MIYPSDLPTPYTDSPHIEHNLKIREVKCEHCHYVILTDLISPKCGKCHNFLITVVKSNMTNELA